MRNKHFYRLLTGGMFLLCLNACRENVEVGKYVDPNIGGVAPLLTTVTPQVHRPHAMVRIYPLTEPRLNDRYLSDHLYGITINMPRYRLGETASVMPTTGELRTGFREARSWYDHGREELHPWGHRVILEDYDIDAEWTTTERCCLFRFVYPEKERANLLFRIKGEGELKIEDNRIIKGWEKVEYARQYFYIELDKPFEQAGIWEGDRTGDAPEIKGSNIGGWLSADRVTEVEARVGISFISVEQAQQNLEKETGNKTFAAIREDSRQIWEKALGRIRVEGGTEREKRIFYTSLYRTYERMVNFSEDGKYYSGFDRQIHADNGRPFYNDDWIWDTYRNLHALGMILEPDRKADMLQSYVEMYKQWGWMPNFPELTEWGGDWVGSWSAVWKGEPMIGNHTASLFAEAYEKGVRNFDLEKAYEGIRKNALEGTMVPWRSGPASELDKFYAQHGYFPALAPGEDEPYDYVDHKWEKRQAVSVTLEQSYDDWCLAQFAKALGKDEDYDLLMKRSRNYLNLWNPEIGYFAPKNEKGEWIPDFDPQLCDGFGARSYFAEVNACVHVFHIQHDIPGLIGLMGGNKKFIQRLDDVFNEPSHIDKWKFMGLMPDATGLHGMIPVGNEPAFHIPYLYNYAGAAWKTQFRTRQLADLWFDDRPTGLSGDEDGGALCAWYVFTALGFYPVNPASGEYAITSPVFSRSEIQLPEGKSFVVQAKGNSLKNKYIQSARLNGKPYDRAFISHADIMKGGILELEMGEAPNKSWGKAE